jgi:hypothetical protein
MDGYSWNNQGRKEALEEKLRLMLAFLCNTGRLDTAESLRRILEDLERIDTSRETRVSYALLEELDGRLEQMVQADDACRDGAREYEKAEALRSLERAENYFLEYSKVGATPESCRESEIILEKLKRARHQNAEEVISSSEVIALVMRSYARLFKKLGVDPPKGE